jgi:Flp pilus assembly protein TadB
MACWFYLVIATYLYIWLITGEYNSLPASVLALIGVSGATGLAAIFVDNNKTQSAANQRKSLEIQRDALEDRIAELAAAGPAARSPLNQELQQKRTALAETNASVLRLPQPRAATVSTHWWVDILSDGDGVSFPRFQILVWTVVLMLIFIRAAYRDLAMPDFNASLLGLMGISSGTYVGFKFPEKQK